MSDILFFVAWYSMGLIAAFSFFYFEWRRGHNISYGDVTVSLFVSVGGPIVVAAGIFIVLVGLLSNVKWNKTLIKGKDK